MTITQERLKEILHYDPLTGECTYIVDRRNGSKAGEKVGCIGFEGYRYVIIDRKNYRLHRIIWLYSYGSFPDGVVDHINMNKSDNRLCNLRDVSLSQNRQNMLKYSNNTSGHKGVSFFKATGRWHAQIKDKGKRFHLGFFKDIEDAVDAYAKAAGILHQCNPDAK